MSQRDNSLHTTDWAVVLLYFAMVIFGWVSIYAADYDPQTQKSIFDTSTYAGKHLIRVIGSLFLILIIALSNLKFYNSFAYPIYIFFILLLILVLVFGKEVAGSKSWFDLGFIRMQPAEFTKFATALAIARFLEDPSIKVKKTKNYLFLFLIISAPIILIILQGDTGSALIYFAFIVVFYREGLSSFFMFFGFFLIIIFIATLFLLEKYFTYLVGAILAIGMLVMVFLQKQSWNKLLLITASTALGLFFVFSFSFILTDVLKEHQRKRIEVFINPSLDPLGYGYQTTQSKIAIGSGGLIGKGFLQGTQTKFEFVPEQTTDFIFCTIGEESGWVGSVVLIALFTTLLFRLIHLSERQHSRFARVYGYGVTALLFLHFTINIGMTIGLLPVIGIPLPFFSYGGSSLWAFTILLFIFIKMDAHRYQVFTRLA